MTRARRLYSDAEMRRILEQASTSDPPDRTGVRDGYTLDEIRAVARDVGIDGAAVDRAAAALEPPSITHSFLGLPLTMQKEMVLPPTGDGERERMKGIASCADRVFGSPGAVTWGGGGLQWYNERERAFVGVAAEPSATRVRVIADLSGGLPLIVGGIGIVAAVAVLNILLNSQNAADLISAVVVGVIAVGGIHVLWARRARTAMKRMSSVLDEAMALLTGSGARS